MQFFLFFCESLLHKMLKILLIRLLIIILFFNYIASHFHKVVLVAYYAKFRTNQSNVKIWHKDEVN